MLSVTIITYNEENNIERCLKSLDFCEDIVVIDSFSQDKTKEICSRYNVTFVENKFEGYGQQKNFATSLTKNDWVFNIDADEVVTPELRNSILSAIKQDQNHLFKVKRLTDYCGKWIYHGGWYPNKVNRLFNKKKAKWSEPHIHEELYLTNGGEIPVLEGDLLHYSFPTVKSQVLVNLKYAELGSKDLIARKGRRPNMFEVLVRPFGKFVECYFLKLGILDGREGLVIAINASYSMFMKYSFAYFSKR